MQLNNTPLYIGTSGYNHEDWKGNFAPREITNYDMLTYYAEKGFNFLEIAFTFYRMPEPDKMAQIIARTGDKVKLSIRIPKGLSRDPHNVEEMEQFKKGIAPVAEAGMLACLYADYHPSFSASKKNQEQILALRESFPGTYFFAELANRTWYKGRIFDYFKETDIGMTIIDMPQGTGFAPYYPICTNNALYFKFYGKNPAWLTIGEKFLDDSYSNEALMKFKSDAINNTVMAKDSGMAFASVANGQAPQGALSMMALASK